MKKKLFFKLFLAFIPMLIMVVVYICADPFMTFRNYDSFYNTDHTHLELNEDYVATEVFKSLYPKTNFDSYVFGSSRSRYFVPEEWGKHIPSKAIYQYGVASETLYGIAKKISFLHNSGVIIKNALIIIDVELLAKTSNTPGHLFMKHPLVSGDNQFNFQLANFMDFFNGEAISSYLHLMGQKKNGKADPQLSAEDMIVSNKDAYYQPRLSQFYKRPTTQQYSKAVIGAEQKSLLQEMKKVFDSCHTDYRIVISPLYDQKKPDANDIAMLQQIFGANSIYDFSGINDITADMYNFYETSHYRPAIAYRIMDSVYARHN